MVNLAALVANPNNIDFISVVPPAEVTNDHILGGVTWITDTELAVHWLNRRQNYSVLKIYNILTGTTDVSDQFGNYSYCNIWIK